MDNIKRITKSIRVIYRERADMTITAPEDADFEALARAVIHEDLARMCRADGSLKRVEVRRLTITGPMIDEVIVVGD